MARWATIDYVNGQFGFYARRWSYPSSYICQLPAGLMSQCNADRWGRDSEVIEVKDPLAR